MANEITLDGNAYSVFRDGTLERDQSPIQTVRRTVTGAVDTAHSGYFGNEYKLTLIVTATQLGYLRTTRAKAPPTDHLLNFIDAEGIQWNPASSGNGVLNTGVIWRNPLRPRVHVLKSSLTDTNVRFLVDVELLVNAKGIATA